MIADENQFSLIVRSRYKIHDRKENPRLLFKDKGVSDPEPVIKSRDYDG